MSNLNVFQEGTSAAVAKAVNMLNYLTSVVNKTESKQKFKMFGWMSQVADAVGAAIQKSGELQAEQTRNQAYQDFASGAMDLAGVAGMTAAHKLSGRFDAENDMQTAKIYKESAQEALNTPDVDMHIQSIQLDGDKSALTELRDDRALDKRPTGDKAFRKAKNDKGKTIETVSKDDQDLLNLMMKSELKEFIERADRAQEQAARRLNNAMQDISAYSQAISQGTQGASNITGGIFKLRIAKARDKQAKVDKDHSILQQVVQMMQTAIQNIESALQNQQQQQQHGSNVEGAIASSNTV